MAKGKSENKSSRKYGSQGRRLKNKKSHVEREITRAEAKIRQINSRLARKVISEDEAAGRIKRQQQHIKNLKERLDKGFNSRVGWSPK